MRDRLADLGFSGTVPVFPLPEAVLFPGVRMPLHIFEPRYQAMVKDAWAGERLIALATLLPGWEKDYEGAPPFHPLATVGRIVERVELPEGRSNLVLEGLERARLDEEFTDRPYRLARAQVVADLPVPSGDAETAELKERLLLTYAYLVHLLRHPEEPVAFDDETTSLESVVHVICQNLDVPVFQKLRALEAAGPLERAPMARGWLAERLDLALAERGLPRLLPGTGEGN
jgi:Lon protease-like protein